VKKLKEGCGKQVACHGMGDYSFCGGMGYGNEKSNYKNVLYYCNDCWMDLTAELLAIIKYEYETGDHWKLFDYAKGIFGEN